MSSSKRGRSWGQGQIQRTGRPRDEAKMFVKDIAAWSGVVQEERRPKIRFSDVKDYQKRAAKG